MLVLAACSIQPNPVPEDPLTELTGVPFFPQTIHECGPAALATVLNYSAATATPDGLAHEVYIPERQGSLQIEMLAATRRNGRLPFVIDPQLTALRAELAAGLPVLVLQDLGALWIRRWHYAVVVGYDPATDTLILRSGTDRRRLESVARFDYGWERAGRWGMVVLPPGVLPATATPERYTRALTDAAGRLPAADITVDFAAAVARWGNSPTLLFAAANQAYASGLLPEAQALYDRVLALEPEQAAARNNLATLLLDRGCVAAGQREAALALNSAASGSPFLEALRDTNRRAEGLESGAEPAECHL